MIGKRVGNYLGKEGLLSSRLEGFEYRHQQMDMAAAVEETFGKTPLKAQLSWPEFLKMLSSARRKVEYEVLGEETSMSGSGIRSSGVSEVSATTRGSRRLLAKRLK